jgi:hypothetical protein
MNYKIITVHRKVYYFYHFCCNPAGAGVQTDEGGVLTILKRHRTGRRGLATKKTPGCY